MKHFTSNHGQKTSLDTDSAVHMARQGRHALGASIRRLSFWVAILLPVVYLPLLAGWLGQQPGSLAIGLLALNLIALFVGHSHNHTSPQ